MTTGAKDAFDGRGSVAATMQDVARRAGVSASTVSHVLNGTRRVSGGTRERVVSALEELGYRPNLLARGFRTRQTFTVGLLVSDIQNPFFTSAVRGVEDVALAHGYHLFLCNTDEDPDREDGYVRELVSKGVDGLIVASVATRDRGAECLLGVGDVPFVFLDREVRGVEADSALVDNGLGMRLAAEHLAGLGHERVGLISGPLGKVSGYERYHGLREAMAELGANFDEGLVRFGDFRSASGRSGAKELLTLPEPPTALVSANNQMTLGVLLAVRELGLKIPEDVSLVGFDDPEWASVSSPPLTTISQPAYEIGATAMRMLLGAMSGEREEAPHRQLLDPRLVVRGSTARLRRSGS